MPSFDSLSQPEAASVARICALAMKHLASGMADEAVTFAMGMQRRIDVADQADADAARVIWMEVAS